MTANPPEVYRTRAEIVRFFNQNGLVYLERTRVAWRPLLSMDLSRREYYLENRDLEKDAFIGEYTGVIQEAKEKAGWELEEGGFESDYSWYYLEEIKQAPTLEINGRFEGNELRYVNHGNEPNVDVEHALVDGHWVLFFKTARKIYADEQLLISYGDAYWEDGYRGLESL